MRIIWILLLVTACSLAQEKQAEGPEVVPAEKANKPMTIVGMETAPTFKTSIVDIMREPGIKLLLDNDSIRAYRVDLEPKAELGMHWHKTDTLIFRTGDFQIDEFFMTPAKKDMSTIDLTLEKRVHPADAVPQFETIKSGTIHMVHETGWKPYHTVVIELKKNSGQGDIEMLTLAPGQKVRIEKMARANSLLISLVEQQLADETEGAEPATLKQASSEVKWYERGKVHAFTNTGTKPTMLVLVPCR